MDYGFDLSLAIRQCSSKLIRQLFSGTKQRSSVTWPYSQRRKLQTATARRRESYQVLLHQATPGNADDSVDLSIFSRGALGSKHVWCQVSLRSALRVTRIRFRRVGNEQVTFTTLLCRVYCKDTAS